VGGVGGGGVQVVAQLTSDPAVFGPPAPGTGGSEGARGRKR